MPALYDFVSVGILLVVLLLLRRRARPTGFLIAFFAVWYGIARIIEDFFRVDVTHGTGLTGSQWSALATLLVALGFLIRLGRQRPTIDLGMAQMSGGDAPEPAQAEYEHPHGHNAEQ